MIKIISNAFWNYFTVFTAKYIRKSYSKTRLGRIALVRVMVVEKKLNFVNVNYMGDIMNLRKHNKNTCFSKTHKNQRVHDFYENLRIKTIIILSSLRSQN